VTAFLRAASPALVAALAAGACRYSANLITITLIDGTTVFNWTDFDQDLDFAGTVFTSRGQYLSRPSWKVSNTTEVPDLSLKVSSINTAFNGGGSLELQIHSGLFDGATFLMQRAMMGLDANPNTLGVVPLFGGKIAGIDLDGLTATIGAKGKINDLDQYAPRNLYQIPCNWAFCSPGCTLSKSAYTASYDVGADPTTTFIPWASAPSNATTYQNGTLVINSGSASGSRRSIAAASSLGLTLAYPLSFLPSAGDAFSAIQGCDKTLNSGSNQSCTAYGNTSHYRGFPDVPQPSLAY
jgi:uncharacterized phage protein (TIGR02218 family)